MNSETIKARLEYLRGELRAEQISMQEIWELQSLSRHIAPGDVELLEAAGVPEHTGIETKFTGPLHTQMSNGSSFIVAPNGKLVAGCYDSLKAKLWDDNSDGNAAELAHRFNCYPEMLSALEALLTASEIVDGCEPDPLDIEHLHKAHDQARRAISKAKGSA